jgi:diaminopimelate epimerase
VALSPEQVRFMAHRRLGIGCDQVLVVEAPDREEVDFGYRIFNADGNEVEQCGNGARCFARFVREHGLTDKDEIAVSTAGGVIVLRVQPDGQVSVDMGEPRLDPASIPFEADKIALSYPLEVDGRLLEIAAVSMGNPHAVLRVDDVQTAPVAQLGPLIEHHARFPRQVNAGFMEIVSPEHIRLRVHERGTGETLACGTGACAAVVAGRIQGLLVERVAVDLPGGRLMISWRGDGAAVTMTGPATSVFEGAIDL